MYERSLRMKMEKTAKEMQEQLAFDLQILEQLLEESRNEAMEEAKRKVREENGKPFVACPYKGSCEMHFVG